MNLQQVAEILSRMGPDNPDIQDIEEQNEGCWAIGCTDGSAVRVNWLAEPERLVFSALVGHPSAERRMNVLESLLVFNSRWRENEGVRMALDGTVGEVVLQYEFPAEGLTQNLLEELLVHFTELAQLWHGYVTSDASALPDPPFSMLMMARFA